MKLPDQRIVRKPLITFPSKSLIFYDEKVSISTGRKLIWRKYRKSWCFFFNYSPYFPPGRLNEGGSAVGRTSRKPKKNKRDWLITEIWFFILLIGKSKLINELIVVLPNPGLTTIVKHDDHATSWHEHGASYSSWHGRAYIMECLSCLPLKMIRSLHGRHGRYHDHVMMNMVIIIT